MGIIEGRCLMIKLTQVESQKKVVRLFNVILEELRLFVVCLRLMIDL